LRKVRIGRAAALLAAGAGWYISQAPAQRAPVPESGQQSPPAPWTAAEAARQARPSADPARDAFENRRSGQQLVLRAIVLRILSDDRDGSRHQRFIIHTDGGITLLVAHNIDLASRLDGLAVGDRVQVSGEYEWNAQGGLLHWTHHDPAGRHRTGYIEWKGRRYQ
jgi:hypothetical protein